jgi:hypothetical protein
VLPPTEQFLGTLDRVAAVGSSLDNSIQVPNERLILDTEELELVGDGLPIIHGVSTAALAGSDWAPASTMCQQQQQELWHHPVTLRLTMHIER